ncbi:MAG: DNA alkylation repair protein [Bdellovibrionaceae bacterium]|nr:DNA alkylation repair protein [Pseudobdellovibrionaceae bacterium]MBX3033194.1 DNA alkylation repair protein [Pseudobdellovibrionaceae bacterium]
MPAVQSPNKPAHRRARKSRSEEKAFKNWLNAAAAKKIAAALKRAWPEFPSEKFLKGIGKELEPLELKARVLALKERLALTLPPEASRSFPLLRKALRRDDQDDIGLSGFLVWPLTQYVAEKGLEDFELSMGALHAMTQVFTAEFAIRPFLLRHEEKTLRQLRAWLKDPSEHVRRLVSEGSRPLLPWGQKIPAFARDPLKTWPLLEALRDDASEYVRTSVANHLNDHSKNHGDWVVTRLQAWQDQAPSSAPLDRIIRRASRTLVKQGHSGALALHGVTARDLRLSAVKILTPRVRLGGDLRVRLTITNASKKSTALIVDHELDLLKASGRHAPKVFKGKKTRLGPGESLTIEQSLKLKAVTTRTYHGGRQHWTPLVNGQRGRRLAFELLMPRPASSRRSGGPRR